MRKFGLLVGAAGLALMAGAGLAQKPAAPKQGAAPPPAAPSNEAPELVRLRALLGREIRLSYDAAVVEGARLRLTGMTLRSGPQSLRAEEAVVEGVREDGFDRLTARGVSVAGGGAATLELTRLTMPAGRNLADVRFEALTLNTLRASLGRPATLERLVLREAAQGREAVLEAAGLLVEVGAGMPVEQVALARLDATASDLPGLIGALGVPPAPAPGRQTMTASGLELRAGGRRLGGVERIRLSNANEAAGVATGRLALEGIEVARGTPLGHGWSRWATRSCAAT